MDFSLSTPEQVRALVAATHGRRRPQPFSFWRAGELETLAAQLWGPFSRIVLRLWLEPDSVPPPRFDASVIEDELRALCKEGRWDAAARLAALQDGAEPNELERIVYREWYQDLLHVAYWPVYYVARIGVDPDNPTGRAVYVVTHYAEMDRQTHIVGATGPLRTLEEIVDTWIDRSSTHSLPLLDSKIHFEPWDEDGRRLQEMYVAARLLRDAS